MAHIDGAAAGFADHGEGFDQQIVEHGSLGDSFFKLNRLGGQVDIGKRANGGFELVNNGDRGPQGFDLTLVLRSEDFGQKGINHEMVSFRRGIPNYYFTLLRMTDAVRIP